MTSASNLVFLLDVDNTLLDNDRFSADLDERLVQDFGARGRDCFRSHYRALHDELGFADYLGAVQRLRTDVDDDPKLMHLAAFILDYPFSERLFPAALETIAYLDSIGVTVILSDGDMVLQPRKVQRSGLWQATAGRVLIYVHKQSRLVSVQRHWPAAHYIMVDDKPVLLAAMKRQMGVALTTVFVRQGHYAFEQVLAPGDPPPDITIDRLTQLQSLTRNALCCAAAETKLTPLEQP